MSSSSISSQVSSGRTSNLFGFICTLFYVFLMTSCGIVFYKTGRILALDSLHALHFHVSSGKIGGQILFHIEYKCFPLHVFASCAQTILVWTQKSYHKVHKENYSSCQQIFELNIDKLKITVSSNNLPWHNFLCKRCNCRNLLKQLYGLRTPVYSTLYN